MNKSLTLLYDKSRATSRTSGDSEAEVTQSLVNSFLDKFRTRRCSKGANNPGARTLSELFCKYSSSSRDEGPENKTRKSHILSKIVKSY